MRRAIATITGTIAVLVMLLSFKTQPRPVGVRPAALAPARPSQDAAPAKSAAPRAGSAEAVTPKAAARPTTVTGQAVQTDYGPVQVQITVTGTTITDVQAVQLPNDRRRSVSINNFAAPVLRKEALAAQSARIDTVSGATYTSDGYAQSLQSALDQAHVG